MPVNTCGRVSRMCIQRSPKPLTMAMRAKTSYACNRACGLRWTRETVRPPCGLGRAMQLVHGCTRKSLGKTPGGQSISPSDSIMSLCVCVCVIFSHFYCLWVSTPAQISGLTTDDHCTSFAIPTQNGTDNINAASQPCVTVAPFLQAAEPQFRTCQTA